MNDMSILRRLGRHGPFLDAGGGVTIPASGQSCSLTLSAADVARLLSADWVALDRGRLRRTATGDMALRRALSSMPDDRFAEQHREIVLERRAEDTGPVATNTAESPLAWLATRRDKAGRPMISPTQLEAGRRLAFDHERARRRQRVTQSWDVSGVRGDSARDGLSIGEAALDALDRVRRALDAVGPDLATVLFAVCCEERGLEVVEKQHGWPARCGKVVLRLALDRLAQHYGMAPAVSGAARVGLVHWGAADYRPSA